MDKARPYECNYCPFRAARRDDVAVHTRVHTGDKPFKCRFCDFRSAQGGNVRIHERRHTGEKPYTCPFCPYAAVTSTATTSFIPQVWSRDTVCLLCLETFFLNSWPILTFSGSVES